jgi:hypothetical protein
METNELIKIWNTLAENKLINKELAKENILQIISKKGGGIIHKMIKKANFDYYLFLSCTILVPFFLITAHWYIPAPFPNMQSYIGLMAAELFFIYMLFGSIRNRKFLNTSSNDESIKESIENINFHLKLYLKNYFWISLIFGYIFLVFGLLQFLVRIGGINYISFSASGLQLFASHFIIFILAMMILWPLIIKIEIKIRYARTVKDINTLLDQLKEEI